ncbi:GSCOCG00012205001-RA-CDS [Cotesia congregata]|nr:GSCOCG00012205001-RA-CDS [Cotesia congregata]
MLSFVLLRIDTLSMQFLVLRCVSRNSATVFLTLASSQVSPRIMMLFLRMCFSTELILLLMICLSRSWTVDPEPLGRFAFDSITDTLDLTSSSYFFNSVFFTVSSSLRALISLLHAKLDSAILFIRSCFMPDIYAWSTALQPCICRNRASMVMGGIVGALNVLNKLVADALAYLVTFLTCVRCSVSWQELDQPCGLLCHVTSTVVTKMSVKLYSAVKDCLQYAWG